ncbi:aminotransferase class I/II-fold pyridoxal phosphate-dependent enzyme [Nonomuraea sp. SYSU D8015]|uniref:aminotransferase class I/II-fold pyridoxal phosphate-dependent enzyme n=1 Tax=Nonomuraea sp. SYSU D8015 TaxID=2593644 RepID=UPI0016610094|nr:aminotransferase class I/II-fold pyridoxal phosphate-dependent enzyme [Nonomuraea sp. SYSU D8015]
MATEPAITGSTAREITASVEQAVESGALSPGASMPSVRGLAARLGVSPTTVSTAYRELRLRGVVAAEAGRGTRVVWRPPLVTRPAAHARAGVRDLASGNPDPDLLPSLRPAVRRLDPGRLLYGAPTVDPELIEVGRRLFADLDVAGEHVAVVSGAMDGLERVLSAHLRPGDRVAVEDPGHTGVLDLVRAMGFAPVPVAVDEHGMLPEPLSAALERGSAACVVTPRAQNPTGAALTADRARELRRVLTPHEGVLVVENDHASLISGAGYVPLVRDREADAPGFGAWAVIRSISKLLGPDLRVALVAADRRTASRVEGRQRLGAGWVSHVLQRLVIDLWSDPATQELIARAAATYAERREAALAALAAAGVRATGRSGFNVVVPVAEEAPVLRALREAGWELGPGEPHRIAGPPFVRITTATLDPAEAVRLAADLAGALAPAERRSHLA